MAHVPPFPEESFDPHSAASLALQACDDVDSLHVVRLAYACIEKLVVPQRTNDTEEIYPLRTELAALMRLMNEELQRRIDTADATIEALRLALLGKQPQLNAGPG